MLFTTSARERIIELLQGFGSEGALRVGLLHDGSPVVPELELDLVELSDREAGDIVVDGGGFPVLLDAAGASRLEGAVVHFTGGTFEIAFTTGEAISGGDLAVRIAEALEQRVNPAVAAHGGRITLVGVQDGVAYVRMSGGCQGCGLAAVTLRQGVERMLREAIPELAGVRDITDHAGGRNPFYAKS